MGEVRYVRSLSYLAESFDHRSCFDRSKRLIEHCRKFALGNCKSSCSNSYNRVAGASDSRRYQETAIKFLDWCSTSRYFKKRMFLGQLNSCLKIKLLPKSYTDDCRSFCSSLFLGFIMIMKGLDHFFDLLQHALKIGLAENVFI